jgi:2TM domain
MRPWDCETGHEVARDAGPVSDRERARERLQLRRDFGSHVVAYLVINAFLVGVWAFTGAGYFWPAWVLGVWGAGLALHAWEAFLRRPITESDIDAELRRFRR